MQIGLGFDIHRIKPVKNGGFFLAAGTKIPAPYRVLAHSDGDLLYHAAADALASALGMADIGHFFPSKKSTTRGIDSLEILKHYLVSLRRRGGSLLSVSAVIAAEKPPLDPHRRSIQRSLAGALGLPDRSVGLTFKTFEGIKPLAQNSIACWVNCLVQFNDKANQP